MSGKKTDVLRLPKKHAPKVHIEPRPEDGARLVRAQSVRNAITAGLIVVVVFGVLWAMLSTLIGRIFPWMTLILGILIGLAVRRAGRGIDWRFPLIAAVLAVAGSFADNIVVAAAFTAAELEVSTLTVLRAVTAMTWPVFIDEVMTPADLIFTMFSAVIAAFYANHRLTRAEFLALRKWQEEQENAG